MARAILFIVMLHCIHAQSLHGQERSFYLKAKGGLNLSQVDGDLTSGFSKAGLHAGLVGVAVLSERTEIHTELLYNQKGSKFKMDVTHPELFGSFTLGLDYLEVPILLNYTFAIAYPSEEKQWDIYGGVSLGRLIHISIKESQQPGKPLLFKPLEDELDNTTFSLILGLRYNITSKLGFSGRFTLDLVPIYEVDMPTEDTVIEKLRPYFIGIGLDYNIF